jgi:hypothetical protein
MYMYAYYIVLYKYYMHVVCIFVFVFWGALESDMGGCCEERSVGHSSCFGES